MNELGSVYLWQDLKKLNTYGIGGKAHFVIYPYSIENTIKLIQYLNEQKIPWYVLGDGSNVLLPDEDFDGAIILLKNLNKIIFHEDYVEVEAGCKLGVLIQKMVEKSFGNLTALFGIPGTLGGAILGNAGANKKEIFDEVLMVTYLDEEGNLKTKDKEKIEYSYRSSEFKNKKNIIVKCTLRLKKSDKLKAREQMQEYVKKRKESQPLGTKNAGSVFKNPPNGKAGKIIDELGLKGTIVGGAKISEKHGNFIINFASAKNSDIISLINLIKKEVKAKKKIDLEEEQIIVKW